MNIKKIYFSSEGRLPRAKFFWYMLLAGIVVSIISYLLVIIISVAAVAMINPISALASATIIGTIVGSIVNIAVNMLFLFFCYKHLLYKRLHDRSQDGKEKVKWILIVFSVMYILTFVMNMSPVLSMNAYAPILNYIVLAVGIVGLVMIRPFFFKIGAK